MFAGAHMLIPLVFTLETFCCILAFRGRALVFAHRIMNVLPMSFHVVGIEEALAAACYRASMRAIRQDSMNVSLMMSGS